MNERFLPDYHHRFNWRIGIPADLWVINERRIGEFIKENGIKRVSPRSLGVPKSLSAERMVDIEYIFGIRGGRKIPHLHYRGDLFLLKPKQWRKFSGAVVQDLSERLAASAQVNVRELLDISDSVNSALR